MTRKLFSVGSTTLVITLLLLLPTGASSQSRGTILQAHTAIDTTRFTVGPSLFSRTVLDSMIKADNHVDSLVVYPSTIRVTEGGSYELKDLYVLAIDSKGAPVSGAPLSLELKAFNCTFGTERIMGFRQGKATMRITSLLPRKGKDTKTAVDIEVEVTSWPNF